MELEPADAVAAEKRLPLPPRWQPDGMAQFVLVSALDISEVTVRGLRLRGRAWRDRPDEAVRLQLEYLVPGGKFRPLWRFDWRPVGVHTNNGKGPPELRYLRIAGSHQHPFFEPVAPVHVSVTSATAKLNDIGNLERPPALNVIVVKKEDFRTWLPLLSQAANVIERGAPDERYRRALRAA